MTDRMWIPIQKHLQLENLLTIWLVNFIDLRIFMSFETDNTIFSIMLINCEKYYDRWNSIFYETENFVNGPWKKV
jgi:hypothetical protein